MRAVEGYDHKAGVRFSTYASFWIKQSIRSAVIKQGKMVRLPHACGDAVVEMEAGLIGSERAVGADTQPEEVAEALRLPKKKLALVTQALEVNRLLAQSRRNGRR